jgi:DNA polymerase-3 subunit epsilon
MIKIFLDLETTGVDSTKHSIHQIAGLIEVDEEVVESFNLKTRPHPKAIIEPEAMKVCGVTAEQIQAYPEMKSVYRKLLALFSKYIDRYNPKDKAFMVGYNNRASDDIFLRAWFKQNGDSYMGSWFWSDSLDVMVLASEYLQQRRAAMPTFKLVRVAMELGIVVEEKKLHEAGYDVYLTREIYRIVTGREVEI